MAASDPQAQIAMLERELQWAHLKIQVLEERLRQRRIQVLGPQSETLSDLQLELLAEEEPSATREEVEAEARREPLPHVTHNVYDRAGRPTSVTKAYGTPDAATTSYTYSAEGRKQTETDPLNNITYLRAEVPLARPQPARGGHIRYPGATGDPMPAGCH